MKLSIKEKNALKEKHGQWAIVTGVSSGIGLELAERLADSGLNPAIHSRHLDKLREVESDLKSKYNAKIKSIDADVPESGGIEKIIKSTEDLNVGFLVVSAGYGTSGLFIGSSFPSEVNVLRGNCEALLSLTHHYSQRFVQQKRGGIILTSSIFAFQGVPYSTNFAATKAYVHSLSEALAVELKPYGVDVLTAVPGPVDSGFGRRSNMKMSIALKPS